MEIVQAVKKLNSISRERLNFRRRPILCTTLYRNLSTFCLLPHSHQPNPFPIIVQSPHLYFKSQTEEAPERARRLSPTSRLCLIFYRNLMQTSNFGGTFDQLFLRIFLSNFHRRCLSTFSIPWLRQDPPLFEFLVIFDFFAPWYRQSREASSVKI